MLMLYFNFQTPRH